MALQEERLSDVLNPITGSRRTVAALEAALDAGDPDLLRQEVSYGLDLVDAGEIALMLFTDAEGTPGSHGGRRRDLEHPRSGPTSSR